MKVTIRVTQDHIDKGCRNDGGACPIFLAIRDAGIPITWCYLTHWTVSEYAHKTPFYLCFELPGEVVQFIGDYDSNNGRKKAKPFEFELEWSEIDL